MSMQGGYNPTGPGMMPPGPGGPGFGRPGGPGMPPGMGPGPAPDGGGKKGKRGKGPKPPKPVTRKIISSNRMAALALAVVTALVALLMTSPKAPETYVLRATKALPVLTELAESHVEAVAIDEKFVEEGAITAKSEEEAVAKAKKDNIIGSVASFPVAKGAQIRADMFATETNLATPLGPDERLLSIRAQVAASVAGTLKVGDRVDVIVATTGGSALLAGMVATDIEIAGITVAEKELEGVTEEQSSEGGQGKRASELLPSYPIPGTYILRVPVALTTKLALADASTKVYLIYRGPGAETTNAVPAEMMEMVCGTGLTFEVPAGEAGVALPAVCPTAAQGAPTVEVPADPNA